ncbi:la-related protein 1B isoform X2 [Aethina tumida]|uniref:la-related protein 1B isoform X2 n=1 Tax=Aethina tumida TaxID=116153 RepID=UPI0021474080|nr:la-related protein 1B isoform X2 [Aethina tumida]
MQVTMGPELNRWSQYVQVSPRPTPGPTLGRAITKNLSNELFTEENFLSVPRHVSAVLLTNFNPVLYEQFEERAIEDRMSLGMGQSTEMDNLYFFWSRHIKIEYCETMYRKFKLYALEDANVGKRTGLKYLCSYYISGLSKNFISEVYEDFQMVTKADFENGSIMAIKLFKTLKERCTWMVLTSPELATYLESYKSNEDLYEMRYMTTK